MRYDVRHRTEFRYEQVVSVSHHVLHLTPRAHARQCALGTSVQVDPSPSQHATGEDYFGNPISYLTLYEPHDLLSVESQARVEVEDAPSRDLSKSPSWEQVLEQLRTPRGPALDAYQYCFDSPYSEAAAGVRAFALPSFPAGRPLLEACMDLTSRIFETFEYQGGVSDVSTPVAEVLRMRKGVCQDFAHLELACLRSLGLAARYVSGYLLTHPPPGQPKLVGSDASHAWLSVWAGEQGWVDFDPTNDLVPGNEHITVAWGRDYGDVSPINGFIIGGGAHELAVSVDVTPVP